jgi:hypothetical protein
MENSDKMPSQTKKIERKMFYDGEAVSTPELLVEFCKMENEIIKDIVKKYSSNEIEHPHNLMFNVEKIYRRDSPRNFWIRIEGKVVGVVNISDFNNFYGLKFVPYQE